MGLCRHGLIFEGEFSVLQRSELVGVWASTLLVVGLWSAAGAAQANGAVETCATCDPRGHLEAAQRKMEDALYRRLRQGAEPKDASMASWTQATLLRQEGRGAQALPLARRAASLCLLQENMESCAEPLATLAETVLETGGGDVEREGEALALLALVDAATLSRRDCARVTVLRYRLAERLTPRTAPGAWADACEGFGVTGELGYRAAKASLVRGDLDEAGLRLKALGQTDPTRSVRSTYLQAVLEVARGAPNAAMRTFAELTQLPPDGHRSMEEDQARVLAFLQLARLLRDAGRYDEALTAYQGVPSQSAARADALLELAVTSAHLGRLQQAHAYLDALWARAGETKARVAVQRLRASLAVVDGDEEAAKAAFAKITDQGHTLRAELSEHAGPDALRTHPGLLGLLDPEDAIRLTVLETQLDVMGRTLHETQNQVDALLQELSTHGAPGALRDAVADLEEASALLRRAEKLTAKQLHDGVKVAGPLQPALQLTRDVSALRRQLDGHLHRLRRQQEQKTAKWLRWLRDEKETLQDKAAMFAVVQKEGRLAIHVGRRRLWQRADDVVTDLEMTAEVGELELLWRRKRGASRELQRITQEYQESMATLAHDVSVDAVQE